MTKAWQIILPALAYEVTVTNKVFIKSGTSQRKPATFTEADE
jgi:hypothetical protein